MLLYGIGRNSLGQLGDTTTIDKSFRTQISINNTRSSPAQVGTATYSTYYVSVPTQIGINSWTQVSAGDAHTAGIRTDYTIWAWGYNSSGQVGDQTTINRSSPIQVSTSSYSVIAAGSNFTQAIKSTDSTIWGWGNRNAGQLGDGTTI